MKPALTREEWETARREGARAGASGVGGPGEFAYPDSLDLVVRDSTVDCDCCGCFSIERNKVAALALHGQPFGFTHEDVTDLRAALYELKCLQQDWPRLTSLADRIAALLPPRD